MPMYSYRCPQCQQVSDRIVSFDACDEQLCENEITPLSPTTTSPEPEICGARLVREEIPLTAPMKYAWEP